MSHYVVLAGMETHCVEQACPEPMEGTIGFLSAGVSECSHHDQLFLISSLLCHLQGPAVFPGRAFAAPRVKLIEDPYQRPELQFFPLRKGPQAAGEVIATFELIELDYSGHLEVRYPGLAGRLYLHSYLPGYTILGCPKDNCIVSCPRECWLQAFPGLTSLDTLTPGLLMDIFRIHLVRSLPLEKPYCFSSWGYLTPNASGFHPTFYIHICLCSQRGHSYKSSPVWPCQHWHVIETHGPSPSLDFPCFGVNSDLFFVFFL